MITDGESSGWFVTIFCAACFLIALLEPWPRRKPRTSRGGGFALGLEEAPVVHWVRSLFWRKSLDDLMAEMKAGTRSKISGDELDLAREYERRRLPAGLRFPRQGEVYEALTDFSVDYITSYHGPYSGGGRTVLPQGERIRVSSMAHEKPIGVYCDPLRYDELHHQIVSEEERDDPYYDGYSFRIDTVDLNRCFRLVAGQDLTS